MSNGLARFVLFLLYYVFFIVCRIIVRKLVEQKYNVKNPDMNSRIHGIDDDEKRDCGDTEQNGCFFVAFQCACITTDSICFWMAIEDWTDDTLNGYIIYTTTTTIHIVRDCASQMCARM